MSQQSDARDIGIQFRRMSRDGIGGGRIHRFAACVSDATDAPVNCLIGSALA
jgi:hypothetical protein